jgi:predicted TIM-barrel fold metal-dependent hydrolase
MAPMPFDDIISADSHMLEPFDLWAKPLASKFGDLAPRVVEASPGGKKGSYFFTGKQLSRLRDSEKKAIEAGTPRAGSIPEERVRFQKQARIAAEVLFPSVMASILHASNRGEARPMVHAAAQVYNDWLAEFCAYDKKRLLGVAALPTDDVAWAVKELERTAKLGFKSTVVHVQPPEGCPPYRNPCYDPLWACASELGMPVSLHIVAGRTPDPMAIYSAEEWEDAPNLFFGTWEEIPHIVATDFILGGILDRFPKLKLVTAELELSWLPLFMQRIDRIQGIYSDRVPVRKLKMKASDYMRHRIWHGFIDEKHGLQAIPLIGVSQIVWGSDFPHSISVGVETQDVIADLLGGLPPAEQKQILQTNSRALFGL